MKSIGRLLDLHHWIPDQRPCNGDPLLLPAAHLTALLAHICLVAVLCGHYKSVSVGVLGGALYELGGGGFISIADVLANGASIEDRFLSDQGDLF